MIDGKKEVEQIIAILEKADKELRSKCEALRSMQWIPVTERLPEDEEIYAVRVILKNGRVNWNRAWYDGTAWHGSGMVPEVTHWMKINLEVEE